MKNLRVVIWSCFAVFSLGVVIGCDASLPVVSVSTPERCDEGEAQAGSSACGLNDRGTLSQECTGGEWVDTKNCTDPDKCKNKEHQPGTSECGLNNAGVLEQFCQGGEWKNSKKCLDDDVCKDKSRRMGESSCGINDAGFLEQYCGSGEWKDSRKCLDDDICVNKEKQPGKTSCGLNDDGAFEQYCGEGEWKDTKKCVDSDICFNDETRDGSVACGLNRRGALVEMCAKGEWTVTTTCVDLDDCEDNGVRSGITACGLNQQGAVDQSCVAGRWKDTDACIDPDICVNDKVQPSTSVCGFNGRGLFDEECSSGAWKKTDTCQDPDECSDDLKQKGSTVCGINDRGSVEQICSAGTWKDTDYCIDPDICKDTTPRTIACGPTDEGSLDQVCTTGQWVDTSACITCGNGQCTESESCSTCEEDCGECRTELILAVIGDYGYDGTNESEVAAMVASWEPDHVVTVGDNNYINGEASTIDVNIGKHYSEFIGNYKGSYGPGAGTAEENRFWPTTGNHDWYSPDDELSPYLEYFTLPEESGSERYYEKDLGLVHLFCLDSGEHGNTTVDSVQAEWLRNTMTASCSTFNLVVFHHAPYSSGMHGPTIDLRWPFAGWGADAVLTGHDHHYERLFVGDADDDDLDDLDDGMENVPYFINGLGGMSIYSIGNAIEGSQARYNAKYGAMKITVNQGKIVYEFYNQDGDQIDTYTVTKSCP